MHVTRAQRLLSAELPGELLHDAGAEHVGHVE
jgi:hypothetical protein